MGSLKPALQDAGLVEHSLYIRKGAQSIGPWRPGTRAIQLPAFGASGHWGGAEIRTDCGAAALLFFS
jgi:hypothetical protein